MSILSPDGVARVNSAVPNNFPSFLPPQLMGVQQEAQPQQQATFDDVVEKLAAQPAGNNVEDVAAAWKAFSAMQTNTEEKPESFSSVMQALKPSIKDPDLFSDINMLGKTLVEGMPQIDWHTMLANGSQEDVNKAFNEYAAKLMSRSVVAAFALLKSAYEDALPKHIADAFDLYKQHKQRKAGESIKAPEGMDVVAKALTERYVAARPNASPEEVTRAVSTLLQSLGSLITPPAKDNVNPSKTDWSRFLS